MARYIDAVKAAEIISERVNIPLDDLFDVFAEIPTADVVEVKHGEWTRDDTVLSGIYYNCSICGNLADKDSNGNYIVLTPYCSLCGAKMDSQL